MLCLRPKTPPRRHFDSARPVRRCRSILRSRTSLPPGNLEYATCAKLVNYPDTPWDEREASRLRPEIAAAMPTISTDGGPTPSRSAPTSVLATGDRRRDGAEHEVHLRADAEPRHGLAGPAVLREHRRSDGVHERAGARDHGHRRPGDTLTINLIQPQGGIPHVCSRCRSRARCRRPAARSSNSRRSPPPAPTTSRTYDIDQHIIASRNPNYHGPRPQHFDALEYDFNLNEETAYQQVLSGELDDRPASGGRMSHEVADLYGPDSPAAARGLQQFFAEPVNCVGYMPLNTERPAFANLNMRKAVNYAVDRTAYGDQAGPYAATPFDQLAGAGHARVRGHRRLSRSSRPRAGARPRGLASRRPSAADHRLLPLERPVNQAQYQVVRQNLMRHRVRRRPASDGPAADIYDRMGIRGEPFDLGVSGGWCSDYNDPWDWIFLYDGTTIHDGEGNLNYSYFNDPVFNDRMHAANELVGDERYDAFQQIEHDLVRDAAPAASMRTYNNRYLFSRRMGCHHYRAAYQSMDLHPPLCAPGDHDRRHDRLRVGLCGRTSRCASAARWTTRSRSTTRLPTGLRTKGTITSRHPGR